MNSLFKAILFLFATTLSFASLANEVKKSDWINGMSTALPTAFCASEQYFRQCFKVTAQECEEVAASATRVCLNKHKDKIPAVLRQPDDGMQWGRVVGACAGEAFETTLIKKRVNNAKCNDPASW